jgi:hypothetical protein
MADVPSYTHEPLVDSTGNLTTSWKLVVSQLLDQLQQGVSNEGGYQVPQKSADELNKTVDSVPNGTHFYDTTNNTPVVKKNGVFVPYG